MASAMEISRPLRTTRRVAIDCRSLDKIQSIIVRDCEKSMEVKEPKQYFQSRVVSKSRKKDGVPHVKISYDGWGREYDECMRNGELKDFEIPKMTWVFSRFPV